MSASCSVISASMRAIASSLSDQEIADLVAYYAQPATPAGKK